MTRSNISSLGGHFYIAPYEHFISGWKGAKRPDLYFRLGLQVFTFKCGELAIWSSRSGSYSSLKKFAKKHAF